MSNFTDISDSSQTQLPIRGEKRIVPTPVDSNYISTQIQNGQNSLSTNRRQGYYAGRSQVVEPTDFDVVAAMKPFVDYVFIRVMHRGTQPSGSTVTCGDLPAVYHFLINPAQISIQRTTIDGQAMTRAGWQIGVWGEDMIQVTLNGKTAGQYWSFGLTDKYQQFTESYRNLEQLQIVFENNGYWFEGEQVNEGPLAADFTRRRIKMHEDVELTVGNFVWFGMFETLMITQSADQPTLASFALTFIAWKEQFRSGSPYQNLIIPAIGKGRGHGYTSVTPLPPVSTVSITSPVTATTPVSATSPAAASKSSSVPPKVVTPVAPAVITADASAAAYAKIAADAYTKATADAKAAADAKVAADLPGSFRDAGIKPVISGSGMPPTALNGPIYGPPVYDPWHSSVPPLLPGHTIVYGKDGTSIDI